MTQEEDRTHEEQVREREDKTHKEHVTYREDRTHKEQVIHREDRKHEDQVKHRELETQVSGKIEQMKNRRHREKIGHMRNR